MENNRLFQTLIFLLFVLALFYGSDFMAIWNIETTLANASLDNISEGMAFNIGDGFSPLAEMITAGSLSTVGFSEWGIRMPSLLMLATSFFAFYKLGGKIFSNKFSLLTLLLAAASFPLLMIGKIGTTDIWLFSIQLLIFPLAIVQLKKRNNLYAIFIVLLSILLVFIHPLSALLFNAIFFGTLFLLHKKGKSILIEGTIAIFSSLLIPFLLGLPWMNEGFLFSYTNNLNYYLLCVFVGLMAALGFLPAVLIHLFKRLRIKEEMAILSFAGILAGLCSISLFAHFVLLLLIAKQIEVFSQENYPYKNIVKTFTILQVLFSFFIAMLFMFNGFTWFQGTGFRKALIFGIPLWGMGIVTLVTLYSDNKKYIMSSIILGGIITNFLFWTQIMPIWEAERNIYKDIAEAAVETIKKDKKIPIFITDELAKSEALHFYEKTRLKEETVGYTSPLKKGLDSNFIYITNKVEIQSNDSIPIIKTIKGREYPWQKMQEYILIRNKK
jgi:hypothetical protein